MHTNFDQYSWFSMQYTCIGGVKSAFFGQGVTSNGISELSEHAYFNSCGIGITVVILKHKRRLQNYGITTTGYRNIASLRRPDF